MFHRKFIGFLMVFCIILYIAVINISPDQSQAAPDGESAVKHFTILHTNDIHARIDRFPILAGAVNEIKEDKEADGEPVLMTDGGDFISPRIYSWLNIMGSAAELKMMRKVGYDVVTLGNHEFDLGSRGLAQMLKNAGYPGEDLRPVVVASNTKPPEDHPLAQPGLFNQNHIKELDNGLTIGFMGFHGRGTIGFDLFKKGPVEVPDPHEIAKEKVANFEEAGVDLIIAIVHDDFDKNIELASSVDGIDILLGGHRHRTFDPAFENDTIIIQTSAYLEHLCMLELAYHPSSGTVELLNEETGTPYHLPLDDSIEKDEDTAETLSYFYHKLDQAVAELTGGQYTSLEDKVARSDFELTTAYKQESVMGNFAADAFRVVGAEKLEEDIDFSLVPDGICSGNLGPGEITFKDIADIPLTGTGPDLLPGHPLVSFYLTGEEVRRVMEIFHYITFSDLLGDKGYPHFSGLRLDYDPNRAVLIELPFDIFGVYLDSTPLPSLRTVLNAEWYTGEGIQTVHDKDDDYTPLQEEDDELYKVVTEASVLYHLPTLERAVEFFPNVGVTPKDSEGNPIRYMDDEGDIAEDAVVYDSEGNEVKAWQALVEYAAMQPPGEDGVPEIPANYAEISGRMNQVWTIPFYTWFILGVALLVGIIIWIRRFVQLMASR